MGILEDYRKYMYNVDKKIILENGKEVIPINFDNGATTPPLKEVCENVEEFMLTYGSIGRGAGQYSKICTDFYENSREKVKEFFNLKDVSEDYTVIYVKNTTEGLNFLANILIKDKSEKVLTTRMEHHANDLPWRFTSNVKYVEVDALGKINLDDIEAKFIAEKGSIKYLTITGASNVTGYLNPINDIAKIAHRYGAKIIVDGAQLVGHKKINMKGTGNNDNIDFLVFSGHKIYAPFGSGVIVGLKEKLKDKSPLLKGGGIVDTVLDDRVYWEDVPMRFEAGSPNFLGVVALKTSLDVLAKIGMENIERHEDYLRDYLMKNLKNIPSIKIYGDINEKNKIGVISFNVKGICHEEVAESLSRIRGIFVRSGCFCAHPYAKRLLGEIQGRPCEYLMYSDKVRPGMVRISLGLYNNIYEVDEFLNTLEYIISK